MAKATATCLLG